MAAWVLTSQLLRTHDGQKVMTIAYFNKALILYFVTGNNVGINTHSIERKAIHTRDYTRDSTFLQVIHTIICFRIKSFCKGHIFNIFKNVLN